MSPAPTQPLPSGKCPLCARAVPIGHPCTYFVCQGYQKNGIPVEDADAALKLKADRTSRGEYTLSHVGRWFGEWLVLSAVSGDRNGPIFKAVRRVHPRKLEVRTEPSTLRIFTAEVWHEIRHLVEEQLPWRFPRVVSWDALGDVGGQGWASHRWLGHYALLSERLLPGRPLWEVEPALATAALTALFDGLASMHDAGVAHGAVRPDQIAFLERGNTLDALLLGPSEVPFYVPTAQAPGGADAGLAWAAPERFDDATGRDDSEGDADEPEPLSGDVYSAGLVVAELVAGRRPFALPTLHVRRQKRHPNADPIATSRALLPPALLEVLDAATRFDPSSRLPDAAALRERLLPLLSRVAPTTIPATTAPARRIPAAIVETPPVERPTAAPVAITVAPETTPTPRAEIADPLAEARIQAALAAEAQAAAVVRALQEAQAASARDWSERLAVVSGRLRDAEEALAKATLERRPALIAQPESAPAPTRPVGSRPWFLVVVALVIGALVGSLVARSIGEAPVPAAPAPLVVNARLTPTGGGTAVRVVVPAVSTAGRLVGTLRLVGPVSSQEVPVSRATTSAERKGGVLLFDETVPFVVDSVIVVSLRSE
ncbi:MAG: hypothetical protein IV100_07140 [Myxococcales bacterium]|nr:hypothetical protein [Myxococcales bacterium]